MKRKIPAAGTLQIEGYQERLGPYAYVRWLETGELEIVRLKGLYLPGGIIDMRDLEFVPDTTRNVSDAKKRIADLNRGWRDHQKLAPRKNVAD